MYRLLIMTAENIIFLELLPCKRCVD